MRNLAFLFVLSFIAACNNTSTGTKNIVSSDSPVSASTKAVETEYIHHFPDSLLENRITDTLMKLSFIKRSNQYIDSFSNHQHGIAFMMDSLKKGEEMIFVEAGYNGEQRFEPYYWFYVDPRTLEIFVYDLPNDKKIALRDYLKKNH